MQQDLTQFKFLLVTCFYPRQVIAECALKPDFTFLLQFHDGYGSGGDFCNRSQVEYTFRIHGRGGGIKLIPVSYTHLDVYKRQAHGGF